MKFSFGITTAATEQHNQAWRNSLISIIDSIRNLNIPEYEIIIVGGPFVKKGRMCFALHWCSDIIHIPFDDENQYISYTWGTEKGERHIPGWITKKKNLITKKAKYENIVYMHDYFMFDKNWYKGFLKFGNDWDICMCVCQNIFGKRCRDWITWDHPKYPKYFEAPYSDSSVAKNSLIVGSFWVAKRSLMLKEPLDETYLTSNKRIFKNERKELVIKNGDMGEDVEWSLRVRQKYKYVMNPHSIVRHNRIKFIGDERLTQKNLLLYNRGNRFDLIDYNFS